MIVGISLLIVGVFILTVVFGAAILALRHHNRQFPKGWDRTGWEPRRGTAGWFVTKFTWLSGRG